MCRFECQPMAEAHTTHNPRFYSSAVVREGVQNRPVQPPRQAARVRTQEESALALAPAAPVTPA